MPVNHVSSDEDTYESPVEEDALNNLVSPQRPRQSASASPRALLQPDPPPTDEVLQSVGEQLRNLAGRSERAERRNAVRQAQEVAAAAAEIEENRLAQLHQAETMPIVAFEDENGVDEPRALQEACSNLKNFVWDNSDLAFTMNQVEIKMSAVGVKKQYTKLQVLSNVLPKEVIDQVKPFLRKTEVEYPNADAYKLLKNEIKRIFGPKPTAAWDRALTRVLVGRPSDLARALVNDICKKELRNCECCPGAVLALWRRHLPGNVRAGIAHMKFNADTFNEVTQLADDIFTSHVPSAQVAAVKLDETQPAIPYPNPEIAATSRGGRGGRGRGGRGGGRGRGRGASNQTATGQQKFKGTKHPDLPEGDWTGCSNHFRYGKSAYFCAEPTTCPWKNIFVPRPGKKD